MFLAERRPTIWRIHAPPARRSFGPLAILLRSYGVRADADRLAEPGGVAAVLASLKEHPARRPLTYAVLRSLKQAVYSEANLGHFGLARRAYLHFTSPIRRYADLVVHRVVKAYLGGARRDLPHGAELDAIAINLNDRTYRAAKAERERMRMLAARLFKQRIGEKLRGNVVALKPFGLIVQLEKSGITATVSTDELPGGPYKISSDGFAFEGESRRFVIGQPLRVEVVDADEVLGRIELKLAAKRS